MTPRTLLATLGLAIAFTIPGLDPRLLTLNLGAVGRGLGVTPGHLGFLASAATLVVAAALLAIGNLGDTYGLKRLLIYGLVAHVAVGLLATLAPNYPILLAIRLVDGLALTALAGLSLGLLTVSVPPAIRPVALGIVMATDALLFGVSPLVGGWLADVIGWRGLFLLTPALALIALALIVFHVAEPPRHRSRTPDVIGVVLFGAALVGLVYGLSAAQNGFGSPRVWAPILAAGLALAVFVRRERRVAHPALDLALFTRPGFVVAAVAVLLIGFLCAGFSVVLGQFGEIILGLSAERIGLLYLPGTMLLAAANIGIGHLVAKYTARPVLVAGLLVMAASGLAMAVGAAPTMALWALVMAIVLLNLGADLASTSASDTILSYAEPDQAGSVAATRSTFGTAGSALGPTVYIALLAVFFRREWLADAHSRGLSAEQAEHAVDVARSSLVHSPGVHRVDLNLLEQASGLPLVGDFTDGVRLTMLAVSVAPLALAVVAYFVMPRRADRTSAP